MKHTIALLALVAGGTQLPAATITAGDPAAGGIGYSYQATLAGTDNGSLSSHVGAWSWQDQSLFVPGVDDPVGWTHTSNWVAVTLSQAAILSVTITRDATVPYVGSGNVGGFAPTDFMYPSFTLWSGWDNDLAPQAAADKYNGGVAMDDYHTYNNTGAVDWAEDLTYVGHVANSTLDTVTASFSLPAGQYSLVIGSDAPSLTSPPRQGYRATFTTTVPEPGSASLALLAGLVGFARRRRA